MLHPSSAQVIRQRRGEAFVFQCGRGSRDPGANASPLQCRCAIHVLTGTDGVLPNHSKRSHQSPHDCMRIERADQLRVERSDALRDGKAERTPTDAGTATLLRNAAG